VSILENMYIIRLEVLSSLSDSLMLLYS